MKKSLFGSLAVLTFAAAGPATAADLPVKAAPMAPAYVAPGPSWTGCWVSGGVGYGMWNQKHFDKTDPGSVSLTQEINTGGEGWLGRVGVGCDYQIAPSFVIGAFGDYDFMNLKGTFLVPVNGLIGEEKQTSSWAAGGRIGYLPYPGLMTFVSAGYTEARFDAFNLVTSGVPSFSTSFSVPATTYRGWFLGGGYEYRLPWAGFSGLYWKTEYRYNKYDTLDVPYAPLAATLTATNMQKSVQTITTSLVWKFNWGGPVRAAY